MPVVLIPWRFSQDRALQALWVKLQWLTHCPGWEVRLCEAPKGPWCKGAAIMDAAAGCDAETIVIADADVWCAGISAAVEAIGHRKRWAIPHLKVHRLTTEATGALFEDLDTDPMRLPTEERPYNGMAGGGIVVVDRETLLEVPFDRRFVGWGREDCAWRDAMLALVGKPWRGNAPLIHLWHPPQPRPRDQRVQAFPHNEELYARYVSARKRPDDMRALIAEAKSAAIPDITNPLEDACMYTYRNENTGQVIESEERNARFDRLDNWHLLGQSDPSEPTGTASDEDAVELDLADLDLSDASDDELWTLHGLTNSELLSRGLLSEDDAPEPPVEEPAAAEAPAEETPKEEPAGQTVTEATDAAIELAEAEGIDLATVTGTGDEGRIVIGDVRGLIEARDSTE